MSERPTLKLNIAGASSACDIGDEETNMSQRQNRIEQILLQCYADKIVGIICKLVSQNCYGCSINHPSQREHDCLMMEAEERLWTYFDDALIKGSEESVMESFMDRLKDMKPSVNGLELLKYTCKDWRNIFCSKKRILLEEVDI